MIDGWLKEIKENTDPESLGMILVHNGARYGERWETRQGHAVIL